MVWESIMLWILFTYIIVSPINACTREEHSYETELIELLITFLQLACICDIIIRNFTALVDKEKKEIILVHKEIVR